VARISYLTSSSFYVDAGRDDGIQVGQILEVMRSDAVIALLQVTDLSSHRAVCIRKEGDTVLQIGDSARFLPRSVPQESPPSDKKAEVAPAAAPNRAARGGGVHGRVGLRYLAVRDLKQSDTGFSQPTLDLRLDGNQIGGSPVGLNVDVRSRQTYRTSPDGLKDTDQATNVYRFAMSLQGSESPWHLTVGRQLSPALASINIFDGLEGEYQAKRWAIGVFTGTQPDPIDFGYSSTIREHGGFVQWHSEPLSKRRWALTTGLVGSYEESRINREFSYLQGNYMGPRLSFWLTQEVDLNRGWKADVENSTLSMTSTFVNVNFRAGEAWTFNAGYDNRRNVRLYRDRITPETEFDDAYRNGVWAGATVRIAERFRIGVDVRERGGGESGGVDGYTLVLGTERLTRLGLDFHSRSSRYTNASVEGWLHSLSMGIAPGHRVHVALTGGVRDEVNLVDPASTGRLNWYGLDFDLILGRRWLFMTLLERSQSDLEANTQIYSSISYRF
jgi:hypothetical protein